MSVFGREHLATAFQRRVSRSTDRPPDHRWRHLALTLTIDERVRGELLNS